MIVSGIKRFLSIVVVALAAGVFSAPSFGADVSEKGTKSQKVDPQTDKERLIEGRKEQQQKRGELRDAVKSGASKDEIEQLKSQVKEGQKAIVQDKKEIREQKLGTTKDQKEARNKARNLPRKPNEEASMITFSSFHNSRSGIFWLSNDSGPRPTGLSLETNSRLLRRYPNVKMPDSKRRLFRSPGSRRLSR